MHLLPVPGPDLLTSSISMAARSCNTMLVACRNETLEIGKLLERTMMQKYGPAELKEHYMVMDTICDATQERQTAVYELVDKQPVSFICCQSPFAHPKPIPNL